MRLARLGLIAAGTAIIVATKRKTARPDSTGLSQPRTQAFPGVLVGHWNRCEN
jgi:hypothetical protein